MAMYYQGGSQNQPDGLQTYYLRNPNFVAHSEQANIPIIYHDTNRPSPISGHQRHIAVPHDTLPRIGYNSWVNQEGANKNQPNMVQKGLSLSLSNSYQDFPSLEQSIIINGVNSTNVQSMILGSKYLKAAQQLLDEVANVGKKSMAGYDDNDDRRLKIKAKTIIKESSNNNYGDRTEGAELTIAQKQEIQMKKAKLVSMLDEVEQRYRQYNSQMHIIVASFEQASGVDSAKPYTQLALKTISKQFRCLKDVISVQINALSKSIGEEEKTEDSKVKYVDNQLRQHRAMQQLGMVQNNTWRHQRGLPERAVSVLRTWLFEHFLHPYPKDTDKQMLAKQTGLTRGQVSNWFINARVRLWKPMVEEMYLEEMKINQQQNENNSTKTSPDHHPSNLNSTSPKKVTNPSTNRSNTENSSKKPNQDDSPNSILPIETATKVATYGNMYVGELNRFNPGQLRTAIHGNNTNSQNTVSLTLGLPHSRSSPGTQDFFNFGMTNEAELVDHENVDNINMSYEQILGFNKNRKPFSSQLLPDFVA